MSAEESGKSICFAAFYVAKSSFALEGLGPIVFDPKAHT